MRSAFYLVIGILIGVGAATLAGQQRDIVSLNHVAIAVADFDGASTFYGDVMGLHRAFAFLEADGSPYLTYFQVNRVMYYVDPWGKAVGYEDVFTKIDMCRKHFAEVGLSADCVNQFIR